MKNTEICRLRDSQLRDVDEKRHGEDTVSREYIIQNCNVVVFVLIFVERTWHNKHYVVLLR